VVQLKARCILYRIDPDNFDGPRPESSHDPARDYWALALAVVLMFGLIICSQSLCTKDAEFPRVEYKDAP